MKCFLIILFAVVIPVTSLAQWVEGKVIGIESGKEQALSRVVISWIGTTKATISDDKGLFRLDSTGIRDKRMVVRLVGFKPDTLLYQGGMAEISMVSDNKLQEVQITSERDGNFISSLQTIKTEIISSTELKKTACCNLGESFETNATVDVTVKDAVFGSKELQVMGLGGSYTQLLTENTPLISGLGQTYGLNYIPGTQIDAISIVKGPGSVVFGPESMSGMINVDLKAAESTGLLLNGYIDQSSRKELNIDKGFTLNQKWGTLLSAHADQYDANIDRNRDDFIDAPRLITYSLLNKWRYNYRGLFSQNSVKALREERAAGQLNYNFDKNFADSSAYGQKLNTNRLEFYGRTGYALRTKNYQSISLLYSITNHNQSGFYGVKNYSGRENSAYLRFAYFNEWSKKNSLNTGLSYKYRDQQEQYDTLVLKKEEIMPGIFIENTYTYSSKLAFITGIRTDFSDEDIYITPRANVKYSFTEFTSLRASAGTGFRTADVLVENPAILSSNRQIIITEQLKPEQSINYGINFLHEFRIDYRKATIGFDVYRTEFNNKIIPDYESDFSAVIFSNLKGKSYSNNFQAEASWKVLKPLEIKIAYKFLDVYSITTGARKAEPYIAGHRTLLNLNFESLNRKWKVNSTWQWYGRKKLPLLNPYYAEQEGLAVRDYSPAYSVVNTQVSKKWMKHLETYVGVENIFNFTQETHILGAGDPNGKYFDSSYVWGPLEGRRIYLGFRWRIGGEE